MENLLIPKGLIGNARCTVALSFHPSWQVGKMKLTNVQTLTGPYWDHIETNHPRIDQPDWPAYFILRVEGALLCDIYLYFSYCCYQIPQTHWVIVWLSSDQVDIEGRPVFPSKCRLWRDMSFRHVKPLWHPGIKVSPLDMMATAFRTSEKLFSKLTLCS